MTCPTLRVSRGGCSRGCWEVPADLRRVRGQFQRTQERQGVLAGAGDPAGQSPGRRRAPEGGQETRAGAGFKRPGRAPHSAKISWASCLRPGLFLWVGVGWGGGGGWEARQSLRVNPHRVNHEANRTVGTQKVTLIAEEWREGLCDEGFRTWRWQR